MAQKWNTSAETLPFQLDVTPQISNHDELPGYLFELLGNVTRLLLNMPGPRLATVTPSY